MVHLVGAEPVVAPSWVPQGGGRNLGGWKSGRQVGVAETKEKTWSAQLSGQKKM